MTSLLSKNTPVPTVVLSGIGGYGRCYLQQLRPLNPAAASQLVGTIDPAAERSPDYAALVAAGVPVWADFESFRTAGVHPDLMAIASPIAFHCAQTCAALEHGLPVLCEKPVAATLDEACRMRNARDAAHRLLAIGYQWSFSPSILALKADILAGRYGAPRRFRAWVAWPRSSAYYARNGWAGRILDNAGRPVYDSPVNNATAHYLHNLLYLLGVCPDRAAAPLRVEAELYRANSIENFDAACLRVTTDRGVDCLFYTAHCVQTPHDPEFILEFERGTVRHGPGSGGITGLLADGQVCRYGEPENDVSRKLSCTVASAVAGQTDTLCGLEAAASLTCVVGALQQMTVRPLGPDVVMRQEIKPGEVLSFVPGLTEAMQACFESGQLFAERGLPWAKRAETVACPSLDG